jgi:hypothetical protein
LKLSGKTVISLKVLDLSGQLLLILYLIRMPAIHGFHVIPPKLYPLPAWQLFSFVCHLFTRDGWKQKVLRRVWVFLLLVAGLLTPLAIIPGLGLLVLLVLITLWPGTLLLYWIISIRELILLSKRVP